jgi:hypothetical protein
MPYKDPERKRQWEQEHREERNARRRKSISKSAPDLSRDDELTLNSTPVQAPTALNLTVGIVMGLSLLLIVLCARWRFRGLPK